MPLNYCGLEVVGGCILAGLVPPMKSDGEAANEHIQKMIHFLENLKQFLPLDAQGKTYADGYIHCLTSFFTIPETLSYMTKVHGLSREEVKKSFAKYQDTDGGRAYMRFSSECARKRRSLE